MGRPKTRTESRADQRRKESRSSGRSEIKDRSKALDERSSRKRGEFVNR
jgi:hypothetical protein